jgi:hypothetical protein
MRRVRFPLGVAFGCTCLLLSWSLTSAAEGTQPTLGLRVASGQNTFHIGERIALELSFSSSEDKRYELTLASYDRSDRMNFEDFAVSPRTGWADPLASYFANGGGPGGGLGGVAALASKPVVVPLDLNEWVRFDQPGVYTVTVSSRRATDSLKGPLWSGNGMLVKSNFVELHIIEATTEWQQAKLRSILQELNAERATTGMQPPGRTGAIADLRYLATKGAIDQLAAGLREDHPDMMFQCAFGLMGLPDSMRATALKALNERMDDPMFPIGAWFLITMPLLEVDRDASPEAIAQQRQRFGDAAWQSALSALPRKEGKARADTVQTLLSFHHGDLTTESKAQLAAILSASFLELPEDRQTMELLWDWDTLKSGAMLPTLQVLAKLSLSNPGSNLSTAYSRRDLKSAALKRWYELDPEGATREILEEIGSGKPSLTAQALSFFPNASLPQFESVWGQALSNSSDYEEETVLASLLVRFGTGAVLPLIASKLDAKVGRWACAPQAAALAYMVKFDSQAARPFLKRAIDARGKGTTACNHSLFQDVSAHAFNPVLTEAALGTLDDSDQQVTMDALIYLMDYGDKTAEQPIWDRYVKWTATWAGKGEMLEHRETGSLVGNWQEVGLGENLGRALIANQGWLADANLISRVLNRCVGEQMCGQLKNIIASAAGPPYHVTLYRSGTTENHQVAQYSEKSFDLLAEKVAQFPKGTTFDLIPSSPQTGDQKALEDEARMIFTKNGMKLQAAH